MPRTHLNQQAQQAPKPEPKRQERAIARREAILETAWQLIGERGLDATSVNTVISELGISKGSFYHHFPSKAALLDAIVAMLTHDALQRVTIDNANTPAIDRLNAYIQSGWQWHEEHVAVSADMLTVMLRPENSTLLQQISATEQRIVRPLLENIIAQGIEEKSFDVSDAGIATEFVLPLLSDSLLRVVSAALDGTLDQQGFIAQLEFLGQSLGRILGAPPNALVELVPNANTPELVADLFEHFEARTQ